MPARWRWILALLAAAALAAALVLLPVGDWILRLVAWVRAAGPAGVAVYAAVYVAATVLLLPGSAITLGAGFAYGPLWGMLLVSPVSVLAATLAFQLGRTVARPWIERRMAGAPRFSAVDEAVGLSGFKIVLLLRLSPLFPFNLLNYALGLTRVRLRDYVLGSWLGMLPGTALYVYLGSAVTRASELTSGKDAGGPWSRVLFWGGLFATLAVVVMVTRIARKALDQAIGPTSTAASNGREEERP